MAMLVALAFPATVSADTGPGGFSEPPPAGSTGGMTVEVLRVNLTAKVVAAFEVAVTCQPKPASEYPVRSYWENTGLSVWVKQASGRSIAFASTETWFVGDEICDGTQHVFRMTASADPSGVPFKNGAAVVAAAGHADYFAYNEETWDETWHSANASTGWIKVRLGR